MKNLKKINLKENIIKDTDGITLISLVVTLIVIIIIATITISVSIGNEGVFTIMSQEKEKFEDKTAKQEGKIDELYTQIEYGANSEFLSDYTRVEYIKSTGTQYIDTGVNPKSTTKVIFDFQTIESNSYGYNGWAASASQETIRFGFQENGFWTSFASTELWRSPNVNRDANRHVYKLENGNQQFDGVTYSTDNTLGNTAESNQTIYLFALHGEWFDTVGKVGHFCSEKIFYCKIYDGNTLIRDFIPCIRNSDNKPGLYDKVNSQFYTNQGTGEFVTP